LFRLVVTRTQRDMYPSRFARNSSGHASSATDPNLFGTRSCSFAPEAMKKGNPSETQPTEDTQALGSHQGVLQGVILSQNYLHQSGTSLQRPLSAVVLIMASVLPSSPMPRMLLTVAFTHSCSSLRPNSNTALAVLYPNPFTWHLSINLGCDDYEAMPLSTALLQTVTFSSS